MNNTPKILVVISILAFVIVFMFIKPIAQDVEYHHFADQQSIFGIDNFWNVISNAGFIISGVYGFIILRKYKISSVIICSLFAGIILTGIGSAYYHYHPDNNTLVWDRLPMTIVFTSFFAQLYSWYFDYITARRIWGISLVVGIFSVFYWQYTETLHRGDLRLYALIQYVPMILMAIIMSRDAKHNTFLFKPLLAVMLFYIVAKIMEYYDVQIYNSIHINSGHSLKHIAAAIATYYMVVIVKKRMEKQIS